MMISEQQADGMWMVRLPLPDLQLPDVLCYLIEDGVGALHVVDPGWDSDANWEILVSALQAIGRSVADVATVVVTHLHADHMGLAPRLAQSSGGSLVLSAREQESVDRMWTELQLDPGHSAMFEQLAQWGVPVERRAEIVEGGLVNYPRSRILADALVSAGDLLGAGSGHLEVVLTPGHTRGSMCLRDDERQSLLTGDHVLPRVHPGLGLGGPSVTNALSDYLGSLGWLDQFDDYRVLPGHGEPFRGVRERAASLRAHHDRRLAEVAGAAQDLGRPTVWGVASVVRWRAGWERLRGPYLWSALKQTAMYLDYSAMTAT